MKQFGIVLALIGCLWAAWAFNMKTSINTGSQYIGGIYIPDSAVNNIGLMDERRNHLMMASVLIIVGVILYGFGTIKQLHIDQAKQTDDKNEDTRKCGYCGEAVLDNATNCKHCGCELSQGALSEAVASQSAESSKYKVIYLIIVAIFGLFILFIMVKQ